jgi:hypothetical protein
MVSYGGKYQNYLMLLPQKLRHVSIITGMEENATLNRGVHHYLIVTPVEANTTL